jgi:hypothetical protein
MSEFCPGTETHELCSCGEGEGAGQGGAGKRGHTMSVTIHGGYVSLTPVCHEPEGAECRVVCALPGISACGTYSYPEHEHGLRDQDYCNAAGWLSESDVAECCAESGEVPLYDGMPIEVIWKGGGYLWAVMPKPIKEETQW